MAIQFHCTYCDKRLVESKISSQAKEYFKNAIKFICLNPQCFSYNCNGGSNLYFNKETNNVDYAIMFFKHDQNTYYFLHIDTDNISLSLFSYIDLDWFSTIIDDIPLIHFPNRSSDKDIQNLFNSLLKIANFI